MDTLNLPSKHTCTSFSFCTYGVVDDLIYVLSALLTEDYILHIKTAKQKAITNHKSKMNHSSVLINADDLRMAVKEVICESDKERRQYEEALVAITVDESLKRYIFYNQNTA